MADLFLSLLFFSLIGLIMGLKNPSLLTRITKKELTRKQVSLFFGGAMFLFFILIGMTAEPTDQETQPTENTEDREEVTELTEETIESEIEEVEEDKLDPDTTDQGQKEPIKETEEVVEK
jgi:colicin import membrane protein